MTTGSIGLNPAVYDYLCDVSLREADILKELRDETAQLDKGVMQISPEQGQFMALMARLIGARRHLEIGTFTGYSALAVALALPDDGEVICCDVNDEWTSIGRRYWDRAGVGDRVRLHIRPALETLAELIETDGPDSFDMAFIDADKQPYIDYYEMSLTLVRPGGLILVDNVLWGGSVSDPSKNGGSLRGIRGFNAHIKEDKRVDISMIPLGDGVFMARKR